MLKHFRAEYLFVRSETIFFIILIMISNIYIISLVSQEITNYSRNYMKTQE
jgi:hypothetical protein